MQSDSHLLPEKISFCGISGQDKEPWDKAIQSMNCYHVKEKMWSWSF